MTSTPSAEPVDRTWHIANGEFLAANPDRVVVSRAPWPGPDGPWEIWQGRAKHKAHTEFADAITDAHQIATNGRKP